MREEGGDSDDGDEEWVILMGYLWGNLLFAVNLFSFVSQSHFSCAGTTPCCEQRSFNTNSEYIKLKQIVNAKWSFGSSQAKFAGFS